MKKVGKFFSYIELTRTSTGIKNEPDDEQLKCLETLCEKVLDPLREMYGGYIVVNSAFRSEKLNNHVGGAKTSQHLKGQAADIVCSQNSILFNLIKNNFDFDQLIWEAGTDFSPAWIHVSYVSEEKNRNEVLRMRKINGKSVYEKIK